MCLIVFAWKTHPDFKLVLAANRDEFHGRPASALDWWPDQPGLLAGRDLQAGGTWLAAHRTGRFATVTNYHELQEPRSHRRSRGELVANFVAGSARPMSYAKAIAGDQYAGFSLLAADVDDLVYVSNHNDGPTALAPGVYGLSNASLDTPWPKVERTRESLRSLLAADRINETTLLQLLEDRTPAQTSDVKSGQLPFAIARAMTAPFIATPEYGTRCSTILLWSNSGKLTVCERRFSATGNHDGDSRFSVQFESY